MQQTPGMAAPEVNNVACNTEDMNSEKVAQMAVKVDAKLLGSIANDVKTRRFAESLGFSLFEAGHDSSCVKAKVGDGNIFRMRKLDPSGRGRGGQLSTGILVGARLLEVHSDCDVALIAKVAGIRGNTYGIRSGKRGAFHVFPNTSKNYGKEGITIHRITELLDVRNLDRYGHLTLAAVKKTIMSFPSEIFSFVEVTSPIMDIIHANQSKLRLDFTTFDTIQKKFYVVNNDVIQVCLEFLEREFFNRMPFTDLNNFSVEFERLDGKPWQSTEGLAEYSNDPESKNLTQRSLLKRNTVSFAIALDYILHKGPSPVSSNSPVAVAAPGPYTAAAAANQLGHAPAAPYSTSAY